jgi:3-aminobutyryl-CoA ammonia-lyase
VYAGDFLEIRGKTVRVGNTSREREYEAVIYARTRKVGPHESSGEVLTTPIVACKGTAVVVIPKDRQRGAPDGR